MADPYPIGPVAGMRWGATFVAWLANQATAKVYSGCAVTLDGTDLTFDVSAGSIEHGTDGEVQVAAQANAGTFTPSAGGRRAALVGITSAGVVEIVHGNVQADDAVSVEIPDMGNRVLIAAYVLKRSQTLATDMYLAGDMRIPDAIFKGADVASAATLPLGQGRDFYHVTGTTTITAIEKRAPGRLIVLEFDGILQLTHHATNLILPGGLNITTAAGDVLVFIAETAGWRFVAGGDPFVAARFAPLVNADTGFYKAGVALGHLPLVTVGFSAAMGNTPAGGGLTYTGTGGSEGAVIVGTMNDLTKGFVRLSEPTISADMTLNAHVGLDLNTDDFDISAVILLDNDSAREIFFGWHSNQQAVGTSNNCLGFRVTNNGNIIGVADSAGVETTRDSGLAGSADPGTRYVLRIVGAAGTIKFYVNGAQVGADVTTNIPAAGTAPYFVLGLRAGATSAHYLPARDVFGKWRAN